MIYFAYSHYRKRLMWESGWGERRTRILVVDDEAEIRRAGQLSRQTNSRLGTRTAGLFHVAAALELAVDYLYTFDQQQRKLARAVGLKVS
jgi:hypothetical protein